MGSGVTCDDAIVDGHDTKTRSIMGGAPAWLKSVGSDTT